LVQSVNKFIDVNDKNSTHQGMEFLSVVSGQWQSEKCGLGFYPRGATFQEDT